MKSWKSVGLVLAASLLTPLGAAAETWSCRHDNDVREVQINRTGSGPVPCEVIYRKLTEGVEDQVLWNAQNDANYCEEKAGAFVARLEGWGWTCVETIQ